MKNKKHLAIFLFIIAILGLCFSAYQAFYAYNYVVQTYASAGMSAGSSVIMHNVIINCAEPFFLTVILCALAEMNFQSYKNETQVQAEDLVEEVSTQLKDKDRAEDEVIAANVCDQNEPVDEAIVIVEEDQDSKPSAKEQ